MSMFMLHGTQWRLVDKWAKSKKMSLWDTILEVGRWSRAPLLQLGFLSWPQELLLCQEELDKWKLQAQSMAKDIASRSKDPPGSLLFGVSIALFSL